MRVAIFMMSKDIAKDAYWLHWRRCYLVGYLVWKVHQDKPRNSWHQTDYYCHQTTSFIKQSTTNIMTFDKKRKLLYFIQYKYTPFTFWQIGSPNKIALSKLSSSWVYKLGKSTACSSKYENKIQLKLEYENNGSARELF